MNKQTLPRRLKNAVATALSWIGFRFTDVEQWKDYYGQDNSTGIRVTADKALTLSSVWACVRLISQTVSTLPVGMYEKGKSGRTEVDKHAVLRIVRRKPNAEMTAVIFWESMVATMLLRGNTFAEKKRNAGQLVALEFLHPSRLRWRKLESGGYEYKYTDEFGRERIIPEADIFHIPGFTTCGKFGMSAIQYGAEVFGSGLAANTAANSTFANGLHPTVAYKYPQVLKENQRSEAREAIKKISGAVNAGNPAILEAGMEAMTIGINPNDAQLLESRSFSVEEVCRWFGVPPSMVGAGDKASSWASSSESLNLWFLQYGLRPILKRIEEAIYDQLLTPTERTRYYLEFNVEGLLRADSKGRAELTAKMLQNGVWNRNEAREMDNLPPIPGGDVYTVQTNLAPIDALGAQDGNSKAHDLFMLLMSELNGQKQALQSLQAIRQQETPYNFNLRMPDVNLDVRLPDIHNDIELPEPGPTHISVNMPAKGGKRTIIRKGDGEYEVNDDAPEQSES